MTLPPTRVQNGPIRTRRRDLAKARIPRFALAVFEALRFDSSGTGALRDLNESDFQKLLKFCDRSQLTLTLDHVCREALPEWVRARIDANRRDYSLRFRRLRESLDEIAADFRRRGIEFVVLKGTAHAPAFTPDPLLRVQGDIDLWCGPESLADARKSLVDLGYRPFGTSQGRHLAPMVRDVDWQWTGNYFAPDLPIAVELHYRLWDEESEGFGVPGEPDFWARRVVSRDLLPALSTPDALAFASLHLLMHLLHGDLRPQRAWEIANFLAGHGLDTEFWECWRDWHPAALRRLEAIVFQFASDWFGCGVPPRAVEEIERLPEDVNLWLERYALSPLEGMFRPNKDEIWLQLCLVAQVSDKCRIALRRVAPMHALGQSKHAGSRIPFAAIRLAHHARALLPTAAGCLKWWWIRAQLDGGFLRFQAASALYCLGMSVFFLLYNLFLLDLGFNESFLGQASSLMSLGTLFGALPAAAIIRRMGLRFMLLLAILGSAAAAFFRAASTAPIWLHSSALVNGVFMSFWAVSYSPVIAGLSNERNRQFAFSLACAAGISVGILGGLVGGGLPGILQRSLQLGEAHAAKKAALLLAASFAALGAIPAARLRFPDSGEQPRRYPRGGFLKGFLAAVGCWSLAVGMFNPFFNAFFSVRLRMGVERIGLVHSCAQALQVLAVLAAPVFLRKLGDVRGIAYMQLAAGLALALLSVGPAGATAALAYTGYMAFQYMSEPGLFKMMMNRVASTERGGASALYFLATSIAASLSALVGGAAISHFGYPAALMTSALLAVAASVLFRRFIYEEDRTITSPTAS